MNATILVIEDDVSVRNLLTTTLEMFGYRHQCAVDGDSAIMLAVSMQPDLYILDLGLPDMDGNDIIHKVRSWTNTPIIVVSARSEVRDKIAALDAGADDYLTKPFSVEELLARIRVALRKKSYDRQREENESVFQNGGLRIDYAAGCVWVDDEAVHLTPIEYKLLCLMARNAGKVLTRDYILGEVWPGAVDADIQSLRVFMATLRKKIEKVPSRPEYIHTHVGIGYRLLRIQDD